MTEFLITCAIGAALSMAVLHIEAVQVAIYRKWQAAVWCVWTHKAKRRW
jgi:hypothetical protein